MSVISVTSTDNFNEYLANNKYVFVDFYATWCKPCKRIKPDIKLLASHYNIPFIKVDVERIPSITKKYQIKGMPTFILFKDQSPYGKVVGADIEEVKNLLQMI